MKDATNAYGFASATAGWWTRTSQSCKNGLTLICPIVTVTTSINHEESLMQTLEGRTDVKLAWASSCVAEKKSGYGE